MGGEAGERGDLQHQLAGDAVQVVVARRGPYPAFAHHEEVGGVAGGDGTGGVQHERLVGTGLHRLYEGDDLVQLGVAVEALVEGVRRWSADRCREQGDAGLCDGRVGGLVLGDYHHVGAAHDVGGMLGGGLLVSPGDHEPGVHVVVHVVVPDGGVQRLGNLVPVQADVQVDGRRTGEQAVQVPVQEGEPSVVQAQPFPDAIAHQEAAVEYRHPGLVACEELAVDEDLDRLVAFVGECLVRAVGHGGERTDGAAACCRRRSGRERVEVVVGDGGHTTGRSARYPSVWPFPITPTERTCQPMPYRRSPRSDSWPSTASSPSSGSSLSR